MNEHKKIEYCNFSDETIYLGLETDFPNVVKIKNQNIEIPPKG